MSRIERDKQTVRLMVNLYAEHKLHDAESKQAYTDLADYACRRLDHCRFGERKPACKDCPVHCYSPEKRAMMKVVMRWAGPRMLFYSPRATLRHLLQCLAHSLHGSSARQ